MSSIAFKLRDSVGSDLLVSRFGALATLSEQECAVLRLIEGRVRRRFAPDSQLLRAGSMLRASSVVVAGWAVEVRDVGRSRRQILGVVLPGDPIGLKLRQDYVSAVDVVALTALQTVEAPELAAAWRDRVRAPGLARALDLAEAEAEWFRRVHMIRLGSQDAAERTASFFCELHHRLHARRMASGNSFPMPLSQLDLAAALGLSTVHINRTLQAMRRAGLIELGRGLLALKDVQALHEKADFIDPVLAPAQPAPA